MAKTTSREPRFTANRVGRGLRWERLGTGESRASVPGGWLVALEWIPAAAFVPDPQHSWDASGGATDSRGRGFGV